MTPIDTIFFDWDGTIIDTAESAFNAFRKAFLDLGIVLELQTYERIYSPDWYKMYECLELPVEKWRTADDLWIRHYAEEKPRLVEGGQSALEAFLNREYVLGIVTSGSRERVTREIDTLGLAAVFRTVVCSDDVVNKKPHPEGLLRAMKQLGKQPDCCCYVGDCPDDVAMGRSAHVLTVAIPGLYPASRGLRAAGPDLWFENLEQFLRFASLKPLESKP